MNLAAKRRAFTVLELLVVVVVLFLLGLFALSSYRGIAIKTRSMTSAATMKNIGQALASYVADHGELPGPCHSVNPPEFFVANKVVTYLWPYLGRTTRPQANELLPEYVPAHWITWLKANNHPSGVMLYYATIALYAPDGTRYNLWGWPGDAPSRASWTSLTANLPLSKSVLLRDPLPNETRYPAFGELQNYTTLLYLDWHVEVRQNP